jgi:tRNA wybutosine-synthesizing protein 2
VLGISVPRRRAEELREKLASVRLVDKSKAILERDDCILIPLLSAPQPGIAEEYGAVLIELDFPERKAPKVDPIESIRRVARVPAELKTALPDKWELLGGVVILRLGGELEPFLKEVGEAYARVLKSKCVLREFGAITGEYREPATEVLYGTDSETTHVENHIKFKLDAAKTMFSSGNEEERLRMATVKCDGETVIDMFAGIGYFSIPLAVYQKPAKVIACEINPVAYKYLEENVILNKVEGVVTPLLGDNRDIPGESVADRIIMGYVKTTHEFLPTAVRLIKNGGTIHYHETCPNELLPERPVQRLREAVLGGSVQVLRSKEIKSYAPGVSHVVVDARVLKPS